MASVAKARRMALVLGLTVGATAVGADASAPAHASAPVVFSTSGLHTYVVPAGGLGVRIRAVGGQGGSGWLGTAGGRGAIVAGDIPVAAGTTLYVNVGESGGTTGVGGAGGGASDVHVGSDNPADRVLVAGGGGGAGGASGTGVGGGGGGHGGGAAGHGPGADGNPATGNGGDGSVLTVGSAAGGTGGHGGQGIDGAIPGGVDGSDASAADVQGQGGGGGGGGDGGNGGDGGPLGGGSGGGSGGAGGTSGTIPSAAATFGGGGSGADCGGGGGGYGGGGGSGVTGAGGGGSGGTAGGGGGGAGNCGGGGGGGNLIPTGGSASVGTLTDTPEVSITLLTAATAPTGVTATVTGTRAFVSWLAPADDGGVALTTYTVTADPGGASCTASAPSTSCTVSGLTPGVAYAFGVTAANALGTGPAVSSTRVRVPAEATLAATGTHSGPLATTGVLLLVAGTACIAVTRRRPRT